MRRSIQFRSMLLGLGLIVSATIAPLHSASANTIVRVSTTMGDFSIELFDEIAPATVANFLNYVRDGDYNGTFFHRLVPGFALQGGYASFQPFRGPVYVPVDPPVVNEFNISNTRGTVAMAKLADNPNSATSQWFVNLADNAVGEDGTGGLDNINGGFTVFGRVLGDGMRIVDAIAELDPTNLGSRFSETPLRQYSSAEGLQPENFITINTEITQRYSSFLSVYEEESGLLLTTVDGGELGQFSLNFSILPTGPDVVFELNQDSLVHVANVPEGAATYSGEEGILRIPAVEVNAGGNVRMVNNLVFVLSDPQNMRFTLQSYDE